MANQKQLELLKQGYEVWNKWRGEYKFEERNNLTDNFVNNFITHRELIRSLPIRLDLSGADLSGLDLRQFELCEDILCEADLSRAILIRADLNQADLGGANLSGADLTKANLSEADLSGADLSGANLKETNLCEANLQRANLSGANLSGAKFYQSSLEGANLSGANFSNAYLVEANLKEFLLRECNFSGANLTRVDLIGVDLFRCNFSRANLSQANLSQANLSQANLSQANLSQANLNLANLTGAICIGTDFEEANIDNARIYGVSIWNTQANFLKQRNLIISEESDPVITVDNLEVAQFIYLLLKNEEIRDVIGTIAKKGVLILGRFTPDRKKILNAIQNKLRAHDFVPMMFDFEKASSRDFKESIKILAGLSRFVIADISNPKSSPLDLQATIPDYKIPFLTIIQNGEAPFSMFNDLTKYHWVLDPIEYDSEAELIENFKKGIIDRALEKENELWEEKMKIQKSPENISNFI